MEPNHITTTRPPRQATPTFAGGLPTGIKGLTANYDRIIDALNRLPRPAMMVVSVALFAYAAYDPAGFAARMKALTDVPEPLWWMQGAVVTFYFGAREAHYRRQGNSAPAKPKPKAKARETS